MEQIETQVTDLRFLTQATLPLPAPAEANGGSGSGSGAGTSPMLPHPSPHGRPHPRHSPYARLPADDLHRPPTLSPRHLSSSSPAAARQQPPILHPLTSAPGDGPLQGATPPLSSAFSPPDGPSTSHAPHHSPYGGYATGGAGRGNAPSSSSTAYNNNSNSNNSNNNNNASPASQGDSGTPSAKRKPDDDELGPKQQRSKRNRYISIACNECKRRKIKCNGETPCQRCGNLNLSCLYSPNCCSNSFKDSDEYKHMTDKMHRLEEQIESLVQNVSSLRQETQRLAPLHDRILPMPSSTVSPSPSSSIPSLHKPELAPIRQPHTFRGGPTSTTFTVDVAKNTLHNMGYSGEAQDDAGGAAVEETPRASPIPLPPADLLHLGPRASQSLLAARQTPSDPLWEFDRNEMVRLCRLHEDEVGIMYPVVKIDTVIEHAQSMASWMESARKSGYMPPVNYEEAMADIRTLTLKIIMCCGLAVEEHGHSEKAIRLYDSIQTLTDGKLMSEPSDLANLPFLALVAGYRFLSNDEVLAWRVMGQVARHCLEQGLHRREGIAKIGNEQERRNAVNTFWSAYVLDRRWSFGTGLPYVLHDDKIDPNLPLPDEYPYLVAMITYSRLGAKIWSLVDFFEPAIIRDLRREEFETLDREILQWYESCPEAVRISNFNQELPLPSTPSYNLQRLQIWTRLRLNQIRIWLNTPVLHSANSINDNMEQAQKVVDLAKDTIRYLSRLNDSSNLYRRIQVFYHQFLTSAIAVLFLASTHQPVQFSANCRKEFYMAMDLVKDMSAKSWVSQRLWRTIRSLKAYAPRLGLQQQDDRQQHYTASGGGGAPGSGGGSSGGGGDFSKRGPYAYPPPPQQPPAAPSAAPHAVGSLGGGTPPSLYATYGGLPPPPAHVGGLAGGGGGGPALPQPVPQQHQHQFQHQQPQQQQQQQQQQQLATVPGTASSSPDQQVSNGELIQTEMTRIFEGYMGMSGIPLPPAGTVDNRRPLLSEGAGTDSSSSTGGGGGGSGNDPGLAHVSGLPQGEVVYEHLKNMF